MSKTVIFFISILIALQAFPQKSYKDMMYDNSFNFYEVCDSAEAYFSDKDINKKGSGWKGYMRWRNANEYKYYPSGDRANVDPFFSKNAYLEFLENNSNTRSLYPNGWQELGPYRIDSVTGGYSVGLGRIEDFYVDPNDMNRLYLGSRSGGFWKSEDGGASWQGAATDFLFAAGVDAIGVSPTNPDSILINVRNSRNANSHGIYRSIDGGDSFTESNFNPTTLGLGGLGTNNLRINKIAYHPTIPNLIFIGTNRGLYRSDDNLANWAVTYPNSRITEIEFHPTNPSIIYIYNNSNFGNSSINNVVYSTDMGLSFTTSNNIAGNNNANGYIGVSADCVDCVFFASVNGVWRSTDRGQNFVFLENPDEDCRAFAVNDQDALNIIYGYVDIDVSTDGGDNFNDATRWSLGNTNGGGAGNHNSFKTSTNYVHADLRTAKSINGVFYVATDGFLSKSEDKGVNWEILSQGTSIRENYKIGVSQSNTYRSAQGSQDNGACIKLQDRWIEFFGADGMECLIHPLNHDYIVTSLQFGARRRTFDAGQTQTGITPNNQSGSGLADWEAPILYDPNEQMRLYNFSRTVYASEDFGTTWNLRGIPNNLNSSIDEAAIAENNSDILVITSGDGIEKSTDAGNNFFDIKGSLPDYRITDITFDPNDDDVIIVVYGRYQADNQKVFISTDGGTNWNNITYNLGNMPILSVVIDHSNESNIYLGAEIGVYTMPMGGNNWSLYNTNLPNMSVEELEVVYGSNTIKAATWGRGIWEYSLVNRLDYPAILTTRTTDLPTASTPKVSKEQFVSSTISYDNTLSSVYVEWSADLPTFGNVINMSNTADSTWVSDTPLPNLAEGTKMFFKVFAVGENNDTSETYKFQYTIRPFEYCTSFGGTNFDGNVTLVDFNTINNPTGKIQSYTDYTNTDSTFVTIGENYDLTVNLNTDNGNFNYFGIAWIDWNQDAEFDPITEAYELGFTSNNSDGPTSISPLSITIPSHATLGRTRMRVACRFNQYPNACDEGFDGEVEDYTIIIEENPLSFSIEDDEICINDEIRLTFAGPAQANNIEWEFTNGTNTINSNGLTASALITEAGFYDVQLTATVNNVTLTYLEENVFLTVDNINPIITANENLLSVNPKGLNYTWFQCDNNFEPLNDGNEDSFLAIENGSYAVRVENENCIDTSDCFQVRGISIVENSFSEEIKLFPNPTQGNLFLILETPQKKLDLALYNHLGQLVWQKSHINVKEIEAEFPSISQGVYFLHINSKEQKAIFKVLKE